jgi:glycosyltransferase involved in cell wall biosynthesis
VSDGVADLMAREFGRRPVVIRNSQDHRLDTAPPRRLRELAGLEDAAFCVVTTGNRKNSWRMDETIAAFARLPAHVHLVLVGQGYERDRAAIEAAGIAARVHVLPPVKPTEIVPFIADANAFIIPYTAADPNDQHSLPNKFFQAVAAELPLLYPPLPEMVRLAGAYELGLPIEPGSATSIRDAIDTWLQDPRRLAAARGRRRAARNELSWEREERILFDVISDALAR